MAEPKHALFIGGPWDGQRRALENDWPVYNVAIMERPRVIPPHDADFVRLSHTVVRYKRCSLLGVTFFVLDEPPLLWDRYDLAPIQRVVKALVDGYRVPLSEYGP